MKIAVDFDGTIAEKGNYPNIGSEISGAFENLKKIQKDGHKVILWTVRKGDCLDEAVSFCRDGGIEFYAVNENKPNESPDEKGYSRKLKVDLFIDDRNVGGILKWDDIYKLVKNNTSRNITIMENKKEIRNTSFQVQVAGEDEENRTVEGYALLFNTPSDGLSFEEVIQRGALDGVLEKSDVFALLNHSKDRGILARCKKGTGSLTLSIDNKGLKYRFEAPKTALGDELIENIRRGEVDESSFCFDVSKDTWEKKADGRWKRTIEKIDNLYDIAPVYDAAYSKTTVYMRGKELAEEELRSKEQLLTNEYYLNIEKSLNI